MKKLLLSFLTIFMLAGVMLGQTIDIYVSAYTGNDVQDGGSWQTAYRTIDAAFDRIGGTPGTFNIYVAQGQYLFEDNQGNGGDNNNEYGLGAGQYISILGGYASPSKAGGTPAFDPISFTAAFDTQDGNDRSAFRLKNNTDASLTLKNITLLNARQGGDFDGAFITFDATNGATFTMDNVKVNEWESGNGITGVGFAFVYNAVNTTFTVKNSLIERNLNSKGGGQFLVANGGQRNLDVVVDNSIFRNIRGIGTGAGLFDLRLSCNNDQGESSMLVENSKFLNVKRGTAQFQAAAIFRLSQLPILTLRNNIFEGNQGGYGGVLDFRDSGELISEGNLWQDNYTGHSGGAIFVSGDYPCDNIVTVKNSVTIINDQFLANHAGTGISSGRGGAIYIASGVFGGSSVAKKVIIENSKFYDNFTASQNGGAVLVNSSEPILIKGSVFCNNESNRWYKGNSAGSGGGVYSAGAGDLTITNSTFYSNITGQYGGALYTGNNTTTIDGCSYFDGNIGDNYAGAIWSNNPTAITNAYFANNSAVKSNGGAIYFESADTHTIESVTFINNQSAGNGGAIRGNAGTGGGLINLIDSYFIDNSAVNNGGAVSVGTYGLSTNNIIFDGNKAGDNGGAIYVSTLGGQTFDLNNSKYVGNTSGDLGGAISFFTGTSTDTKVVNNVFLNNVAANRGGAISVQDRGIAGNEIDLIDGNIFFGNNVAGNTNNTDRNVRSDIYLANGAGLYQANIGALTNNALQFAPTSANYPNASFGTGYRLGAGNTQQTAVPAVDYTAFVCNPLECPIKEPTPPSPLVLSADGQNTGTPSDYTTYTDVFIDNSCIATPTEVAFTARSNRAVRQDGTILDLPAEHIVITYSLIKTNNLDGTIERTDGLVIDANSADRVEDTSNEIPPSNPRDIYRTYYLDLTGKITAGYTYTYTITQVVIPSEGTFDYEAGLYKTVLVTEFCDSDGDGIPNYVESPDGKTDPLGDDDGDGVTNIEDTDSSGYVDENGDGIDDNYDTDGDGQPDYLDIDSDNDGILDTEEAGSDPENPVDTDGDGVPDYLDLDSDNDGINDVDEGNPDAVDADGDGMVDGPYGDNGLADSLESDDTFDATVTPPADTDGDGTPDYQDLDSDGDGIFDSIDETPYGDGSTPPQSQDPSADADGDGMVDDTTDVDGDGIMDVVDENPNVFGEAKPNCEVAPNLSSDNIKSTQVGISTLNRNNEEWLVANNQLGAYIVLESSEKGFVVPRYATTSSIENNIGTDVATGVEEGMIVWDNEANCLKMFYDNTNNGTMTWNCISNDTCTDTQP